MVVKHSKDDTILCALDSLYIFLCNVYFSLKKNTVYVYVFLLVTEILGAKSCVFLFVLGNDSS